VVIKQAAILRGVGSIMRKGEGNIKDKRWPAPPWGTALLVFAAMVMLQGVADFIPALWLSLRFDRSAFTNGAWWQLMTAQWVHWGMAHALANGVACASLMVMFYGWVPVVLQGMALAGGLVGVAVVIALDPQCAVYAGASGALHGYFAGAALALCWDGAQAAKLTPSTRRLRRIVGVSLLALLLIKLWAQRQGGSMWTAELSGYLGAAYPAVQIYTPAHWAGAVGGLFAVAAYLAVRLALQYSARRP
jgi:membrane associated rhomboid family serine protease